MGPHPPIHSLKRVVLPKPAGAETRVSMLPRLSSSRPVSRGRATIPERAGGMYNLVFKSTFITELPTLSHAALSHYSPITRQYGTRNNADNKRSKNPPRQRNNHKIKKKTHGVPLCPFANLRARCGIQFMLTHTARLPRVAAGQPAWPGRCRRTAQSPSRTA